MVTTHSSRRGGVGMLGGLEENDKGFPQPYKQEEAFPFVIAQWVLKDNSYLDDRRGGICCNTCNLSHELSLHT
jgi:hypothetical protein